jgi:hypothetical protein
VDHYFAGSIAEMAVKSRKRPKMRWLPGEIRRVHRVTALYQVEFLSHSQDWLVRNRFWDFEKVDQATNTSFKLRFLFFFFSYFPSTSSSLFPYILSFFSTTASCAVHVNCSQWTSATCTIPRRRTTAPVRNAKDLHRHAMCVAERRYAENAISPILKSQPFPTCATYIPKYPPFSII